MPASISYGTPSRVRFSSTIRFVDRDEFDRSVRDVRRFSEIPGDNLKTIERGATKGILMCNAGAVVSKGNGGTFFHFSELFDLDKYLARMTREIHKMREENPDLRAFLLGGMSHWPFSVETNRRLRELFKRENIPTTVFYDQDEGDARSNIAYDPHTDTWTVGTMVGYRADRKYVDDQESLKKAFKEIKIDPGDTVEIGGRIYTGSELNQ